MSEINEKKWEEALEKIDEKYIDKAIEEMASHSEEAKITAEKSFNKGVRIAKITGGIAASVAVITGVGAIMNANGITISELWEMRPSEVTTTTTTMPDITEITTTTPVTDNTTTPPVSGTNTEETDVPDDTPETILMGKSFITQNGYEYSFSYEYTQTGGETRGIMSKLRMEVVDLKNDNEHICDDDITDLSIVGDNIEIYNEENTYNCVELQVFEMSGYDLVHINIPHKIEGQSYGAYNQSVFLIMTENDDGTCSFKDVKGPDGNDFECYPSSVYKLKDEDTILIYRGFITKTAYKIDIENLKFTEYQISDIDIDEANIVDIIADLEPLSAEEEFSIFENRFYGKWELAYTGLSNRYANDGMEDRDFSYYGDTSTESWGSYERGFYEDETGWYMTGLNGGIGNAHFIPKNDPDTMYFYQEMPCQKNQYYCIFARNENETEYDTDINAGSLNNIGLRKLQHITDCDLSSIITTEDGILKLDDGSEWTTATNLYYGTGKTYLNEISENRIRVSQRYFTTDESLYDPFSDTNVPYPEMQYVTFTIDKTDGQWKLASADRYDRTLETREGMTTEYTEKYLAEAERMRNEDNIPNAEMVIAVEYFTDSTGHYYAYRRIGINRALDLRAGELYYFNGVEYELMQTYDNYAEVAFLNNIIYVSHCSEEYDEQSLSYFSKTSIMGLNGNGFTRKGAGRGNFVTMKNCIVYTHETADEKVRYIINGDRHNPKFTEIKDIEYSDGSSGFRAETEDGEKITYSDYDTKLSDQLWLLNSRMESIYDILWGGDIRVDMEDSIFVRDARYGYVADYNLHDYFLETVENDLAAELLNNAPAKLYLYNGKYYAPEMTGYTPKYAASYEIISENLDTAEVKYTVYMCNDPYSVAYFTGPYTYTATLTHTKYGWRFESFKNDGVDAPISIGDMSGKLLTCIGHYRLYSDTPEANSVDMNDSITVDGNTYYCLDTYEGFKEYESGFFSEKAVDEILLKLDTIRVSDGKVYMRHEPSEKAVDYTYNFTLEKADSDSIELSVTFWNEENKVLGAVAEGIPFTFIYENDKWVLDSFSFPE